MNTKKFFERSVKIHFRESDAAGLMYFANVFSLAHDTFESFIVSAGIAWAEWFRNDKFQVPIRHAESDYLGAFLPGQTYQIRANVDSMSDSTFTMKHEFFDNGETQKPQRIATVRMAHTFIDAKSKTKIAIPIEIRQKLEVFLTPGDSP